MKTHLGQRFVDTEESQRVADIYFHLLLPSQSEVQREEIEKHRLMLERGNIRLPLRLLHPQNPGRKVERKGKNCSMIQKVLKQTLKDVPDFYIYTRSFAQRKLADLVEIICFDSSSCQMLPDGHHTLYLY